MWNCFPSFLKFFTSPKDTAPVVQLSYVSTALNESDSVSTSSSQEASRRPTTSSNNYKVAARKVAGVRKKELDWKRGCFTMKGRPPGKLPLVHKETMQRLNKHKKNGKKFALATSFRRAGANENTKIPITRTQFSAFAMG